MKKLIFASVLLQFCFAAVAQQIGIGTTTPHQSAMLDITSPNKGVLVPRMNSQTRMNISSPATSLMVYDTDTNSFWFYNGTTWTNLANGNGTGFSLPFDTTLNLGTLAFRIANSGQAIEGSSTSGAGVNANSTNGTGLNAFSSNGFGIVSTSVNSTAIYAFSNNAYPTINASNSNASGPAIKGNSTLNHGILGLSGGTTKAGVRGEATGSGGIGVFGMSSSASGYGVYGNNSTGVALYGFSSSGTGVKAFSSSGLALDVSGNVKIAGGNTTPSDGAVLTSDASGNAKWENNRIAFRVKGVNSGQLGISHISWRKVEFETEDYDLGNNYALLVGTIWPNSSIFTAPKGGIYHFDVTVGLGYLPSGTYDYGEVVIKRRRNGVTSSVASHESQFYSLDFASLQLSTDIQLMAGDQIWIEVMQINTAGDAATLTPSSSTYFSGRLVIPD